MAIKVVTSKIAWAGFVRRAKRAFPKEHVEAIWGEETVDSYRITDFVRMKLNASGCNTTTIDYDEKEVRRQKWLAEKNGKIFLGTIHTHPYSSMDSSPSTVDHHEAAKDGERVIGVMNLYKKNNRFKEEVDWWFPQHKITFELLPE